MRSGRSVRVAHRRAGGRELSAQQRVVRVARVVLDDGHHRRRRDEARQVVDVAVGVVADDAVAEPQDVPRAEVVAQMLLDLGARRGADCDSD